MTRPDWRLLVDHCFERTQFMTLATHGPKGLWANPVYFAWDGRFDLYFISEMNCTHVENLLAAPDVVCTIFPTDQDTLGDIVGVYAQGRAHHITDAKEKQKADEIYYERLHGADQAAKELDFYRLNPSWHLFKVSVAQLWYFDTRYFGETRMPVPEEARLA
jgi:uncharacterized protein YhbP (UPF0306 family)